MSVKPFNVVANLTALLELYWDDPVAFGEDMLDFVADDWQKKAMTDVANNPRVSVRSGQGVGKTGFESVLVIWFLCCRPNSRVVCTAPTRQQLNDVLWSEIAKWLSGSKVENFLKWTKTKVYMIGHEKQWFATARTATKPENMQGFHADYMLFIVDEASGVADPIMEAIQGTLSGPENKLLMCGNPTRISGVFYDSHNKDRADYKSHKVSSYDSKRTSKDNIEMLIRKYGAESDVVRVRVYGEFPRAELDTFISLEAAEFASTEVNLEPIGDTLTVGVDVARFGDDETAMYAGIGAKVVGDHFHSKKDTMITAGWVLNLIKQLLPQYPNVVYVRIRIDDGGVGGGVTDRLNEVIAEEGLGYDVFPINNNATSLDEHYADLGIEMWAFIRDMLEKNLSNHINALPGELQLPNDDKLISQLTTRKWTMTSKGKMMLERKKDMKKRGLKSPDRADAFVLTFGEYMVEPDEHIMTPMIGGVTIKRN